MYQIVKAPNPVLSAVAKKITKIDASIKKLVTEMTETLENAKDPEGVGLAAPQVGKSLQLFLAKETEKSPVIVFINPQITSFTDNQKKSAKGRSASPKGAMPGGKPTDVKLEGCLSLTDVWGVVKRHDRVTLSYTDFTTGQMQIKMFKGFLATIIQHEVDHLHGILFPKRVLEQKGTLYKSKKNEKGETVFEEIKL
ncbi:MAG: peptide deformylase [Candidatus Levybacteria bacterium]|nr:peptide deformylase [Candidatus Levybacteria bacterium]